MIGDRWGVSQSEVLRAYPCDDFVAAPVLQAWRGIRIEAPAGAVWPWVAQIRLAPYSYDQCREVKVRRCLSRISAGVSGACSGLGLCGW
jgi:hypothetical protein